MKSKDILPMQKRKNWNKSILEHQNNQDLWHSNLNKVAEKIRHLLHPFQLLYNKYIIRHNLKNGVFAVEISSHHGIGAKLEWALEILAFCEDY